MLLNANDNGYNGDDNHEYDQANKNMNITICTKNNEVVILTKHENDNVNKYENDNGNKNMKMIMVTKR